MWDRAGPGGPRHTGSSRSPHQAPRADSGRAPPHAAGAGRPAGPAPGSLASGPSEPQGSLPVHTHLLLLRGGCLRDFRRHTAPSATRRREKMRSPGGRGRPAAAPPQARPPPLSERPLGPPPPAKMAAALWRHGASQRSAAGDCGPPKPGRPSRAAPLPTLPRFSGSATPKHFLSSFKGRGSCLTSHPSSRCFLGIVVYKWSRFSPPFPACSGDFTSTFPGSRSPILLLVLGTVVMHIFFWTLQSSVLLPCTSLSPLRFAYLTIFIFHIPSLRRHRLRLFSSPYARSGHISV